MRVLLKRKGLPDIYIFVTQWGKTEMKKVIVEYSWLARERGISNNRLIHLIDIGLNGLLSFTKAPIRLMTLIVIILAFGS